MNRKLTILLIALLPAITSFGQTDTTFTPAYRYKTNEFDVTIFSSNYIDHIGEQRFTPTREEIEKAEQSLRTALKTLNKNLVNQSSTPIIHKNLSKYKRQYFGYIDKNGDRILLINCFWSKDTDDSDNWLTGRVMVFDGGSYYWNVKFNLDKSELFDLIVNGYA